MAPSGPPAVGHGIAARLPVGEAAADGAHPVEAAGTQQRRGHARAIAARADRRDRPVVRQGVEPFGQLAGADVDGARDVPRLVFGRLADVDDERRSVGTRRPGHAARASTSYGASDLDRHGRTAATPRSRRRRSRRSTRSRCAWPGATGRPGRRPCARAGRRGVSTSTIQPSQVPNDGPAGIDSESGIARHGMRLGRPRVDHDGATPQRRLEAVAGQWLDLGHPPAEQRRARLVERPHPREVARERRLPGEQRAGERVDVHRRQQRVVSPLEADGRPRRRRDPRRAQRSGAMGRVDHDRVLVGEEHVVERAVHRRGERSRVLGARAGRSARPPRRAATRRSGAGTARRRAPCRRRRS